MSHAVGIIFGFWWILRPKRRICTKGKASVLFSNAFFIPLMSEGWHELSGQLRSGAKLVTRDSWPPVLQALGYLLEEELALFTVMPGKQGHLKKPWDHLSEVRELLSEAMGMKHGVIVISVSSSTHTRLEERATLHCHRSCHHRMASLGALLLLCYWTHTDREWEQ